MIQAACKPLAGGKITDAHVLCASCGRRLRGWRATYDVGGKAKSGLVATLSHYLKASDGDFRDVYFVMSMIDGKTMRIIQ